MNRDASTTGTPIDPSESDGFDHETVEARWQREWQAAGVFDAPESPDPERASYVLAMFPYTSGELHMGHVRNYAITDAYARYRRLQGDDVLHPMGWDAFGLPAENAALQARESDPDADVTPESYTRECIAAMREDFETLGLGFDWSRELATCDPEYYRWNQWLFTEFRDAGLVDRQTRAVNWCPACETVLADEQVETDTDSDGDDGSAGEGPSNGAVEVEVCWRCDTPIVERDLEQWFFKITEYADELLEGLDDLADWPASVVDQQRNWIGRTEGAEVDFTLHVPDGESRGESDLDRRDEDVTVFTTRLDTIHGATFVALAPDHPIAAEVAERDPTVREFVDEIADPEGDEPQGVATDLTATNPATGEAIPVYVANFVLSDVGTGALMAVPAHDERDHAFAAAHDIEIRQVVAPADGDAEAEGDGDTASGADGDANADAVDADRDAEIDVESAAFTDDGVLVNSGAYDGLSSADARAALVTDLPSAESTVQYRLRDWGISRQRYWGTPIPIVHCPDCGAVSVPDEDLPVELPAFVPSTGNPLDAAEEWKATTCPECGEQAVRETDTMDTFVGSSWYYARFAGGPDAVADAPEGLPFDVDAANAWLPVDEYVGGDEHAVMHLLYARFVAKALRDLGYLDVDEPFTGLTTQGMVLGEDGAKMSKSGDNGVSPERIVREYGADTARAFALGAAEPEREFAWNPEGVDRRRRQLDRVHDLATAVGDSEDDSAGSSPGVAMPDASVLAPMDEYVARAVAATVEAVTAAYEALRFDRVMRDVDALLGLLDPYRDTGEAADVVLRRGTGVLVRLIAPIAPHVAEAAWEALGGEGLVATAAWPTPTRNLEDHAAVSRLVERTRADVRDILDTAGIDDPARIEVVVAPDWTYDALALAADAGGAGATPGELTSAVMADPEMRQRGEAAAAYAQALADEGALPANLGPERERRALERAAWLFEREFDATVDVRPAADATAELAGNARPMRPAIQIHEPDEADH
jgi:leucyl-tRNA synthetase